MKKLIWITFIICFSKIVSAQYCTANLGGASCPSASVTISNVTLSNTTLNNSTSTCNYVNGSNISTFPESGGTTATLNRGVGYNLSVTAVNGGPNVSAWIDFNQDDMFSSSEWFEVGTIGSAISSKQISIPFTALTGKTGMRIRTNSAGFPNGAGDACSNFVFGETEDYTVTIASLPCTANPLNAGFTVASQSTICNNLPFTLSLQGNTSTIGILYEWQSSSDSSVWNPLILGSVASITTSQTISTFYRCILHCSADADTSIAIKVQSQLSNCYCVANLGGTSCASASLAISNVSISNTTLNNSHSICTSFNGNYISVFPEIGNTTCTLNKGLIYTLSVSTINGGPINSVWIDYNQDGVFAASEWLQVGAPGFAVSTVQFSIPPAALTGKTGMRIRSNSNGSLNGATDACTQFIYGETEDYIITIAPPLTCNVALNAGSAISSTLNACSNSSFELSLQGNTNTSDIQYQWQSSPDSINWTSLIGAVSDSIQVSQNASTYYRCLLFCFSSSDTSDVVKVNLKSIGCYCTSNLGGSDCINSYHDIGNVTIVNTSLNNSNNVCTTINSSYLSVFADTGNSTAVLNRGVFYKFSVSGGHAGASIKSLWIDFNQDNIFSSLEWFQINNDNLSPATVQIRIPMNAVLGKTGMRIRSRALGDTNGAADACTNFNSGETEDYIITIGPAIVCINAVSAGTTASSQTSACANVPFTLSLQGSMPSSGLFYQWQSSSDSALWTSIIGANSDTLITSLLSSTYYRCIVYCNSDADTSIAIKVSLKPSGCYCVQNLGGGACPAVYYISQVSIAGTTLNNFDSNCTFFNGSQLSTFPPSGNTTATLYQSISYDLTVAPYIGNAWAPTWMGVWIDYNQDNIYSTNEWNPICTTSCQSAKTIQITIPANAIPGKTGMRIRSRGALFTSSDACTMLPSGETEDYEITIGVSSPCSGIPAAGTAISNPPLACLNTPIVLTLANHTPAVGLNYRWQSSADSLLWQDIPGATKRYYSTNQSIRTYYRCIASCSNGGAVDTSLACVVNMNLYLNCYCPSFAERSIYGDIGSFSFGQLQNGIATPVLSNTTAVNTYTNFYSLPLDTFEQGISYPIAIHQITNGLPFYQSLAEVFLDLNHDGIFSDYDELIYSGTTVSAAVNFISSNCLLPYNCKLGITGLRIILRDGISGNQPSCGGYTWGETEDYLVYVTRGSAFAGTNQTSCYPNPVQLNAGELGDANGIWTIVSGMGGSFSDSSSASSTFSGNAESNYVLKWTQYDSTNAYLSDDEMEVKIYAYPNAVISYSGVPFNCSGDTLTLHANHASNYSYQWQLNNSPIVGATDSLYNISQSDSIMNYSVIITNANTCIDTSELVLVNPSPVSIPICVVTVDSLSKFNVIAWEKNVPQFSSDTFCVYRDTANNNYALIGVVPYDSMSLFVDTLRHLYQANGDPNASTWRYKIAVKDVCGNMGPASPYHQSIFFQDNNNGNFNWSEYKIEGQAVPISQLTNYKFYRDNLSDGNWVLIQTLSASSTNYNDMNYAAYPNGSWKVEGVWNTECNPTARTAAGITTSRSNIKNKNIVGTPVTKAIEATFHLLPNPAKDAVTIMYPEYIKLTSILVYDYLGRVILTLQSTNMKEGCSIINVGNLNAGVYTVVCKGNELEVRKKLVVE
ncbi:MAG: T9SS type A sorting domain-containing protein [Bacteroidetes bacterium]|nr:T9SS type A sorting domain-containing protein [Bacteroidota bacterium]